MLIADLLDQKLMIEWLYASIRRNIKRGRIFDLLEVLATGKADCLGYAKLLTVLGRHCGLDLGVVEVIVDTRGIIVPHTATLVRLADGKPQIVDFWYGSTDIRHQRLGLSVRRAGKWQVEDLDYQTLISSEVSYLPDDTVDGINLYIEGNRSLKKGDYAKAVEQYTQAVVVYPENARIYYNRAIAYENLGRQAEAETDYALALREGSGLTRTLATQTEDVVDLIKLDEAKIAETDQQIYLRYGGFVSGQRQSSLQIANGMRLTPEKVQTTINSIERILASA